MSDSDRLKPNEHPGWAVQLDDGSWLCAVHGLYPTTDGFYASIMDTEDEARHILNDYLQQHEKYLTRKLKEDPDFKEPNGSPKGKVIPAWEPMCQALLYDIKQLKTANKITPSKLSDIQMSLEDVICTIKGVAKGFKNE